MAERHERRIAVLRNPRSGSAPDRARIDAACRDAGVGAEILDIPVDGDTSSWMDGCARDYDMLVAAGGDGTVSSVAAAAARAGTLLGVIPSGTLNHFARDAGIPTELGHAIAALRSTWIRQVDLGRVNGHVFLNNVSLGNYPRMVHEREALEEDGRSHALATTVAAARTWWGLRNMAAVIVADGRQLIRRSPFIVIGNGQYTLSGLSLGKREHLGDGRLSIYIAPHAGRLGVLMLPLRALAGALERDEQFETLEATRITATLSRPRISIGIDGEIVDVSTPLEFTIDRHALRVVVPEPAP